jgi:hypothetical protein
MNDAVMILVIGGLAAIGGVLAWNFLPRHRRLAQFADREELSSDSIYRAFFAEQDLPKGLVIELWDEVASPLRLPPGKLRPSDRFDRELAPVRGWEFDDDIVEVHWAAQRRLKKLSVDADISKIQTLQDYVRFFCKLEQERRSI